MFHIFTRHLGKQIHVKWILHVLNDDQYVMCVCCYPPSVLTLAKGEGHIPECAGAISKAGTALSFHLSTDD